MSKQNGRQVACAKCGGITGTLVKDGNNYVHANPIACEAEINKQVKLEINIGSNIIRNTSGVLNVSGKDQIWLEVSDYSQLLLTMDIYDSGKNHIAKLRRNAWVFNNKQAYDITTAPNSLKLIDKVSGDTVVEAQILGKNKILIPQGRFYTYQGTLVEITPKYWKIAGITMSGNIIDSCGKAVNIG
jgi:hypothetical protein